jgi:hypothetical protein
MHERQSVISKSNFSIQDDSDFKESQKKDSSIPTFSSVGLSSSSSKALSPTSKQLLNSHSRQLAVELTQEELDLVE